VYPALAVLNALQGKVDPVLWVGSETGMEADLIARTGLSYQAIPAAGLHGVGLHSLPGNLRQLARGYRSARRILRVFNPDVLLFTGGYVAVPMALAARRWPSVLYVPDIEPGLALKTLARFADQIAITAPESSEYLPRRVPVTVTGYPTRLDLTRLDKSEARKQLGLDSKSPVVLVFGGSKGARSINQAILNDLETLLKQAQVVHITGQTDWENLKQAAGRLPKALRSRYHAYPYLHDEMGAALAAADLTVCRAGASTLGELPLFGLPAILIPYPHAWRYQKVNADYLAKQGAALVLEDAVLGVELHRTINKLLNDPNQLKSMGSAMKSLAVKDAAGKIAAVVLKTAESRKHD
jgi:UDP-N-acetylglucosamine--N-acetylmuramyl-(pentapeptide) pyrophosphoryl-undecaprenol N-acetylglucosamine transferase